ncbi:MAG TPA: alpha-glucosidase [Armatimonadota bacterium]|nr:alpha-glucosidase [Armatimonadota bacterium]
MLYRIVLIGAGSMMFGLGSVGNILKSRSLEGSTIVLHDIDSHALERVERVVRRRIAERNLPFPLVATTSREEALQGADFCIIAIEVGDRYRLWEQDWHIPQQYGIHQVYGENGGPGGLFHSLRIIPPIMDICADIERICPEAWVFNLSNPMTRITLAISRRHPGLKVLGLCHEVVSLAEHLPKILDTPWSNLEIKAGGLNHFSALLQAQYRDSGRDAYPDIRNRAGAYFESLPEGSYENLGATKELLEEARGSGSKGGREPGRRHVWPERELFRVILEKFGLFPITTDSHLGEYVQWAHSAVDHKGILDFYTFYRSWCLEQVPESRINGTMEIEYWRDIPIIEGIVSDSSQEEMAVNVVNNGLIDNLPSDMVVEVPATVDAKGVHGVRLGRLPTGFAGLLSNQVATIELSVEAALSGSRELALQALLVDPVVDNAAAAERTLDTILSLQSDFLSYIH